MFVELSGEVFKVLKKEADGNWLISYENPSSPVFVMEKEMNRMNRIEPPAEYQKNCMQTERTPGLRKRREMVAELLADESFITDKEKRRAKVREIAEREHCTTKRIRSLYFKSLAGRSLIEERAKIQKEVTPEEKDFLWAIETFYYSAKKLSLRSAYDMLLLSRYTDADGHLKEEHPSWHCFRHFYYEKNYHRRSRASISRNGLTDYQRNHRPLFGSASEWKEKIGAFQMDATQADIYLVSRLDRSSVVGRPYIYLAVDTATQLIAGIYVGLEAGEQAVIRCLANAAMDKVEFCRQYGIEITKEEWPNTGLPGEIVTDKGREFVGNRMNELTMKYGIEVETLPPFRPDGKGLVEKSFDLIQQRYKPVLRGKGVIEADAQERWAVDYRSQAILTPEEFAKVVIHCVLYLNRSRITKSASECDCEPIAAKMWTWYEQQNRSSVISIDEDALYQFGLPRKQVSLSRKGICENGLWYVSKDYKKFLENHKIGEKVTIAYDPEDVSRIFLVDQMEYLTFELASYCEKYAGVSSAEYEMERKTKKAGRQELERKDTEGRIQALQDIQEIVKKAERKEKENVCGERIRENRRRELE